MILQDGPVTRALPKTMKIQSEDRGALDVNSGRVFRYRVARMYPVAEQRLLHDMQFPAARQKAQCKVEIVCVAQR